jgi:DNA-binding Lrp family transcriptional regulator
MVIVSYTLIRIQPSKEIAVFQKIKNFPEVKELVFTYGKYDLIVKTEKSNIKELDNFIFSKLRIIDGVVDTTTLIEAI